MELQYRGIRYIRSTETTEPVRRAPDSAIGLRYRGVRYLIGRCRNRDDGASNLMQTIDY